MSGRAKKRVGKNAGAGYGYMFHGSFKEKADAAKKERKTKGAWVKPTLTNKGYRYIVMSPRLNPIKRKKKDPTVYAVEREGRVVSQFYEKKVNAKRAAKQLGGKVIKVKPGDITAGGQLTSAYASRNPHELLIMGANPHGEPNTQEISLPPGSTIVIRTPRQNPVNPANPDRYTAAHAIAKGIKKQAPGLIQTKRQRRVAGMVRIARQTASKHKYDWIPSEGIAPGMNPSLRNPGDDMYMVQAAAELYGKALRDLSTSELSKVAQRAAQLKHAAQPRQNVELGTYENGVFHPWTRRPKSRQKEAIRRQNSSAAAIREDFVGAPAELVTTTDEPHMPAGDYAQLGELLALYVKPRAGGQVQTITFSKPFPLLVSDESARQLWFLDGDQDVTGDRQVFGAHNRGAGVYELGEARRIDYKQRKEHVKRPDVDEWRHEFGEETGVRPVVLYDSKHKRLMLEGGEYRVRPEGIVN